MAISLQSAIGRLTSGRILAFLYANSGIVAVTISVVVAGALAFYVVTVPPGTIAYP